jgi:hypothetical protein
MAIRPEDLDRLATYCETRVPPEMRDRARVFHLVRGHTVTIVESAASSDGGDWLDVPVARMKYDPALGGIWTLYWFDRNSKAHRYDQLNPQRQLRNVLREIERDPTGIFWG